MKFFFFFFFFFKFKHEQKFILKICSKTFFPSELGDNFVYEFDESFFFYSILGYVLLILFDY